MKFIVLIVIFGISNCISAVEFTDCGSKVGKFTKVSVSECDMTKNACILKRNTNATIIIDFESDDVATQIETVVHGIIMGIEMPFPLSNPNACQNSGISCPINKGANYEYQATLPVLKAYPKVTVDVKWQLKNEKDEDIICVLIPAKIE